MQQPIKRWIIMGAVIASLSIPAVTQAIPKKGQPAPPMQVVTTSGQQISLANYRGYVLVIDMFATWCPPCKASVPHLVSLNKKYQKQGLQILGLSIQEGDDEEVVEFITDKKINYPVAVVGKKVADDYGAVTIPQMVVINKKGVVVEIFKGYNELIEKSLEDTIKRLLAEK